MRRTLWTSMLLLAALAFYASLAEAADKGARKVDLIWTAPDFAVLDLRSIAMLPVATYDGNLEARRLTETAVGQALRGTGYRWFSPLITRDMLQKAGGDSLLKALNDQLLKSPRVDSLQAPYYSRLTRSRGLLTVRVDQFEKRELEFNQSGKPTTTVQLHAALVDSTGRLLWTASGTENFEGPYQDASAATIGVKASGLNNQPMTNQGGAPSFVETINKLLARWVDQFPARPVPAASDAAPK